MFCPKCGCHSGPDGSRFCRNCGLRQDGVAQLLARNGAPEGYPPSLTIAPQTPSPRKKGLKKGGKILFTGVALFPIFFSLCFLVRGPGPLAVPVSIFFIGLMRMLYARLFEDVLPEYPNAPFGIQPSTHPVAPPQPVSFLQNDYQSALTPSKSNVPTTGNLAQPPSVSEPTTSLLNRH